MLFFTIKFQLLVVQHVQLTCTCLLAIAALITALKTAMPKITVVFQEDGLGEWQFLAAPAMGYNIHESGPATSLPDYKSREIATRHSKKHSRG